MIYLSAVVLTKNEARNIDRCLSALNFCDEIIVVDDFSTDDTAKFARKYTSKIFQRHLADDFASQRNFGLSKATGPWVLFIDSDEQVSKSLSKEIKTSIQTPTIVGFYIYRQDHFLGKTLHFGESGKLKLLRLAKKDAGKWVRPVHEIWQTKGKVGELQSPLDHYPHPSISEFIQEINHYTTIEARYRSGKIRALLQLITFPAGKFIYNYFFKLGFLDGFPGLIMAFLMSYHSLLVRLKILWRS